ncbi:MAG TPA: chloride channel protein, partial [Longilinea sp.]|nr:chloride channel protein [Longilinea sp.]
MAGVGIWLFKWLIQLVQRFMFERAGFALTNWLGHWAVMLIPVAGGLLVGGLFLLLKSKSKLFGVPEVISAVALHGGKLRLVEAPVRIIGAILSIGSGASVGPEDPSVQIGANFASFIGQRFNLSTDRLRSLTAAGAAAAIAAAFNAPIAGVFFALEVLLADITGSALSLVVLSSVISSAFTRWVSGAEPSFHVPTYTIHSPWEALLYIGLGILAGLTAAAFTYLLDRTKQISNAAKLPQWIKPALAGLVVGTVGIWLPQLFGSGYSTIDSVLNSAPHNLWILLILLAAKLILTPVSLAGGFQGGVFAPTLFLGAVLGAAFGEVSNLLFPSLGLAPAAFALVGMGAVLAASVHAPLMAILLLFEMTNDYRILLPLMAVVIISLAIKRRIIPESVYTLSLARQGIYIEHGRDVQVMAGITVGEVMATDTPRLYDYNT